MAETPQVTPDSPQLTGAFQLFEPSKKALLLNLKTFFLLMVIPLVFAMIGLAASSLGGDENPEASFTGIYGIFTAIGYILLILTAPALIITQLKSVRKEVVGPQETFKKGVPIIWRVLGLGIVTALIYAVSFLLLIVPFFFMLRRYILAPYYLIDRNLSIGDALKASAEDSKKYSGAIWGVIGVTILLSAINFIPLVGWLVYLVLSLIYGIAPAIRYEQIKAAEKGQDPLTPIEKVAA